MGKLHCLMNTKKLIPTQKKLLHYTQTKNNLVSLFGIKFPPAATSGQSNLLNIFLSKIFFLALSVNFDSLILSTYVFSPATKHYFWNVVYFQGVGVFVCCYYILFVTCIRLVGCGFVHTVLIRHVLNLGANENMILWAKVGDFEVGCVRLLWWSDLVIGGIVNRRVFLK